MDKTGHRTRTNRTYRTKDQDKQDLQDQESYTIQTEFYWSCCPGPSSCRSCKSCLSWSYVLSVFILFSFCLYACNQAEKKLPPVPSSKNVQEAVPYSMPLKDLKPPRVVLLADVPKPRIVEVPTKSGGSHVTLVNGKQTKINLQPPEVKPAGFLFIMQNYTIADGLAIDAIICGCSDQYGNLWFGTNGGGSSRFDGKSFTNYSIPQGAMNTPSSILEDGAGNLWMGSQFEIGALPLRRHDIHFLC